MKKTLITLLALAGVAVGAETTQKIWSLDFTGSSLTSSFADGVSLSTLPTTGINNGLTLNNAPLTLTQTGSILTYQDEFIFTVELKLNTFRVNYPELIGMGNGNHSWKGAYYKTENYFVLDKDGFDGATENKNSGSLQTTEGTTLTLNIYNNGNGVITLYVGEDLTAANVAGYTTIASEHLSQAVEKFSFGGRIGGKDNNNSDITVYSASLTKIVPEPTTATLSLLALAGLAARRRRK